jgi:hypothetical protein
MSVGASYQSLADFLREHPEDKWDARFEEVERVLRRPLPGSAYRHQAWWANQAGPGHSQTHGWRSVGWRTTKLDLEGRRVRFERETAPPAKPRSDSKDIWRQAAEVTGISDRSKLIEEGLKALISRDAAERLIALGGSMPDYATPARERPSE